MTSLRRADNLLCAVEVLAQPIQPDPAVDQPQHICPGLVRLDDDLGEVDEPPDCRLGVAAAAPLQLLALSLRAAVGGAERTVEDLQRVVGRALKRLGAEAQQHPLPPPPRAPR